MVRLMPTPRESFLAELDPATADPHISELRRALDHAKRETLEQVKGLDNDQEALRLVMPGLYQQIVATTIQIAAHKGVAVGLSLEVMDEFRSSVSVSSFSRSVRDQMTETGVAMKRRHSSPIAKLVAEVEAQRLAWRHNHEFLSWLAFRRDDERFPPTDRRERLEAFKVLPRLLQSRDAVTAVVGPELAVALEAHDRFMLANRWRLPPSDEHAVERYAWPILSYQSRVNVTVESARWDYDARVDQGAGPDELARLRGEIDQLFVEQLCRALDCMPEGILASGVV
jgi:hypothetical protein